MHAPWQKGRHLTLRPLLAYPSQVLLVVALFAESDRAFAQVCPGDLNGDEQVTVNELVVAVASALDGCPSHPATATPTPPAATPAAAICGDGRVQSPEQCDDANLVGGDGCAPNCTNERRREWMLSAQAHFAFSIPFASTSFDAPITQWLTTGEIRDDDTVRLGGPAWPAGRMPITVKMDDVEFQQSIPVFGQACLCLSTKEMPVLGSQNVGAGFVDCAADGAEYSGYRVQQDLQTSPGQTRNAWHEVPDDPDCDDVSIFPSGRVERACLVGDVGCRPASGAGDNGCTSPRFVGWDPGPGRRGSAILEYQISMRLLTDAARCAETRRQDGSCTYPDYGPDCLPCTADDGGTYAEETVFFSTLPGRTTLYDSGEYLPRERSDAGAPFNCGLLATDPAGGTASKFVAVSPWPYVPGLGAGIVTVQFDAR